MPFRFPHADVSCEARSTQSEGKEDLLSCVTTATTRTLIAFYKMSDTIKDFVEIPQSFIKESTQFINRCTKPNQKGANNKTPRSSFFIIFANSPICVHTEYIQICRMVGVGFVVMGFIGYFVKLIHIPINNIVSACVYICSK